MNSAYGRRENSWSAIALLSMVMALVASMAFAGRTGAQEATPAPPVSIAPDLTTLTINASDTVFSILVPPGGLVEDDYVIELVNGTSNSIANVNIVKLPEDVAVGDFTSVLSSSLKGEGGELPTWWASADAEFVGGTFAAPGFTSQAIVTLSAGKWVVFSSNAGGVQPAQVINIQPAETEGEATPVAEATPIGGSLPSDNQISITDEGFEFASDPTSGQGVWQVTNNTDQVRDVVILKVEGDVDSAAAVALAEALAKGDTVNGLVIGGSGALSPDRFAYIGGTLESGTYVIFSSLPDANGGLQSANGSVSIVTVP